MAKKYIDADKLKAEIERRRLHFNKEAEKYQALNNGYSQNCYGSRDALRDLENFLDTLSEEPDKDLEEAARQYGDTYKANWPMQIPAARDGFIAGAEWKEDQLMKEAVEGTLGYGPHLQKPIVMLEQVPDIWDGGCKPVKVIVIKED